MEEPSAKIVKLPNFPAFILFITVRTELCYCVGGGVCFVGFMFILTTMIVCRIARSRKPWNCIGEGRDTAQGKLAFDEPLVRKDHCLQLIQVWHDYRKDLEERLAELTGDTSILQQGQAGDYKRDVFRGHCTGNGGRHYLTISGKESSLSRMMELYQ